MRQEDVCATCNKELYFCLCGSTQEEPKYKLRFKCGAESPPYPRKFEQWAIANIVASEVYSEHGHQGVGRARDGRLRIMVFDLNGGIAMPKMPDGRYAPCLNCPCIGSSGRKELRGVPVDPRHGQRIIVTCYPREVSADSQGGVKSPHLRS